jgi:hypothetical protein
MGYMHFTQEEFFVRNMGYMHFTQEVFFVRNETRLRLVPVGCGMNGDICISLRKSFCEE